MTLLETRGLTARYGEHTVLRELSVSVPRGELTALLGINGSGKSTLLRALAGVGHAPASVYLKDAPLSSSSRRDIARSIAYVPQLAQAAEMSIEELVGLGRYAHGGQDDGEVDKALTQLGLLALRARRTSTVSGGELRRAWVARALCQVDATGYVLLDEPTAHLDPRHVLSLLSVLRARVHEGGGVVFATHDLSAAIGSCDRLIVLSKGTIRFDGHPRELSAAVLAEAFGVVGRVEQDRDGLFLRMLGATV